MRCAPPPSPCRAPNVADAADAARGGHGDDRTPSRRARRAAFLAEARRARARACAAPIGFVERLVAFWSNHFCVSVAKSMAARASAGAFEREAIRPFVLGRFADMLQRRRAASGDADFSRQRAIDRARFARSASAASAASTKTWRAKSSNCIRWASTAATARPTSPNSRASSPAGRFAGREGSLGEPGAFVFNANAHEPGAATLLGRTYVQDGVAQGEAALATSRARRRPPRHIAAQFGARLRRRRSRPRPRRAPGRRFRDTDGDLGALARALIDDDAAWSAPATKIRNPWEIIIAAHRAFDSPVADTGPALSSAQPARHAAVEPERTQWLPRQPRAWASPEGMKTRRRTRRRLRPSA